MKLPAHIRQVIVPIHPAGWPFIAAGLAAAGLLGLVAAPPSGLRIDCVPAV